MRNLFALTMALALLCQPVLAASSSCPEEDNAPAEAATAERRYVAYGEGLLFRVERAGTPASHIFGTIHLDFPKLTRLPPLANLVLRQSDQLVLETMLDEAAQQTYTRRMVLSGGQALTMWLDGELLARYLKLSRWYQVPEELALRLAPWAATNLISRPRPSTGRTMEDVLRETAIQIGRPLYALETIDELIDAQTSMAIEDQLAVLEDTLCNHPEIMMHTEKLVALYASGDLAGIAALNQGGHTDEALARRLDERMLYARSERMVRRLAEHLAAGNAFVAVGALHLPGERGVLKLLTRQGYSVARVF